MKYKGVTLFSAALILLGSVGTATSYIVDNPTHVSAAGTDTTISKLLGDSKTVLDRMLNSTDDSENTVYISMKSTVPLPDNVLFEKKASIINNADGSTLIITFTDAANDIKGIKIGDETYPKDSGTNKVSIPIKDIDTPIEATLINAEDAKIFPGNTPVTITLSRTDGSNTETESKSEGDIAYDVRNADDDSAPSLAGNFLTKSADVTKNKDGSYTVGMVAKVPKLLDTNKDVSLLEVTSVGNEKDIEVNRDMDSDEKDVIYSFNFSVPSLESLSDEIPIDFIISVPDMDIMKPSANLKFDKLDIAKIMKSEGDSDGVENILKSQINDLQNQLDALTKSKDDTDAKNKNLSNTINDLNSQLKKLKADKDASDSEVASLNEKVSDLESDKKDLQDQQDKLNSQITELTEKVNELTDTGSVLSNTLSDAQDELKKAKKAKSDLEDQLSALQTTADSLKEQLDQALADSNAADPINVDDETDANYTYEVLKENPSDGTSGSSRYFTKKAKVTKNHDGTYTVQMKLNYSKSYGKNAVTFTKIAGNNITDSQYSIKEDGDNYSQTFEFTTDDINDYIPVTMKINIAPIKFSSTESANFKLKKTSDSNDELSELESELASLKDQLSDANNATQAAKDELASKIKDYEAQINKLKSGNDSDDDVKDEYQVPYVVNKTGTNTASASSEYFTKTAFVNPNDDGTFSVEVQMDYPLSYGEDAVKIDSVNGNDIDPSTVTTTSDDDSYLKSFKFNVDNLSDLNNAIPVTMDINIAGGIFSGTETADLVFDTTNLPIENPTNNGNKQVLDNGGTGSGTSATSGTTLGTTGTTGTTSGSLPQTDAKGLPTYIMYAGFIMLAVTLVGAGKVKFTGKK